MSLKDPNLLAGGARCSWPEDSAVALVDVDRPSLPAWTYADLARLADSRASELRCQGLRPGQLVAVPERPAVDLVLMQHALPRAGAALLPVDQEIHSSAVRSLVAETGAEWVWGGAGVGLIPAVRPGERRYPGAVSDAWTSPLVLVVGTSGSTGVPRAAMLSASALTTSADLSNRRLGLMRRDAWLCCLPLRHIGGLSIAYRCMLAGAAQVLREGFDAQTIAEDLASYHITHVSLVPPMLARLLELDRPPPPSLRVVLVGGQHLSALLAERAIDRGWPIHATYGMTETASQIATSERLRAPPTGGRVGLPLAGLELDCPTCGDDPAPLRIRGPLVMAGYANPARVPGLGLVDGWLATSDLACLEADGGLRILGRADDVLVSGGVNVHPARVESVLLAAPGVRDLAVVGVSDPVWGQRLVAAYCGDVSPAELDLWCRSRLRGFERPRHFLPVAEIPLLESGKRDRRRLLDLAEQAARRVDIVS